MSTIDNLIPLEDCAAAATSHVGRKAALLGWAQSKGMTTPGGWVLTTNSFQAAMNAAGVASQVRYLEENALRLEPEHTRDLAGAIRARLIAAPLEEFARSDADAAFARLQASRIVCRSSAVMEDGHAAAFPGIFSSSLDLGSPEALTRAIASCWRSAFSRVAVDYLLRVRTEPIDFSLAVLIQPQVSAAWYGLYNSVDPITGAADPAVELSNESPDALVNGRAAIHDVRFKEQLWSGGTAVKGLNRALEVLRGWADQLARLLGRGVDIEFAISQLGRPILLQCRPLTGRHSTRDAVHRAGGKEISDSCLSGRPCAGASATGLAVDPQQSTRARERRIAVVDRIGADSFALVLAHDGVVVERDVSPLSHVAILCRELGVPLVGGVGDACRLLIDRWICVNGSTGLIDVLKGPAPSSSPAVTESALMPTLTTVELLIHLLAQGDPKQDFASQIKPIVRTYARAFGRSKLRLVEISLSDDDCQRIDQAGAELFGPSFSSRPFVHMLRRKGLL